SGGNLNFHFFQYSDFDLLGTPGGDTVQLGKNLSGLFNEARQTEGTMALSESVDSPGANHGEANFYSTTRDSLNDGATTTLNDNAGPLGPGDVTWAFQWDVDLTPSGQGSTFLISKDKRLQITTVPEPTSMALVCLGLGACSF